jgi:hypothetical protein
LRLFSKVFRIASQAFIVKGKIYLIGSIIYLLVLSLDGRLPAAFASEREKLETSGEDTPRPVADAERHLRFLYSFYFIVKGCNEVSAILDNNEYKSELTTAAAQKIMKDADKAAQEVGVDIESAWRVAAPAGEMAAAALKFERPENAQMCARSGHMFKTVVIWLQQSLNTLGSRKNLIQRDY